MPASSTRPLLVYLQPCDIPEVLNPLRMVPCDQLHVKYLETRTAQTIGWNFFRATKQYTHYLGTSNDLVVTAHDYHRMIDTVSDNPDKPVITALMNVNLNDDNLAVTTEKVDLKKGIKGYRWLKSNSVGSDRLIKVWFSGGMLCVQRWMMEAISFKAHQKANDFWFYQSLADNGIHVYADTAIRMTHLRGYGKIMVGKKAPELLYIKNERLQHEVYRLPPSDYKA